MLRELQALYLFCWFVFYFIAYERKSESCSIFPFMWRPWLAADWPPYLSRNGRGMTCHISAYKINIIKWYLVHALDFSCDAFQLATKEKGFYSKTNILESNLTISIAFYICIFLGPVILPLGIYLTVKIQNKMPAGAKRVSKMTGSGRHMEKL